MQENADNTVCKWKLDSERKGAIYFVVGCLGQSSKKINLIKVARRYSRTPGAILTRCIYCGRKVQIDD